MDLLDWKSQRQFFLYIGMPTLILYTIPATNRLLAPILDFEPLQGLKVITLVAAIMAVLTVRMHKRKL